MEKLSDLANVTLQPRKGGQKSFPTFSTVGPWLVKTKLSRTGRCLSFQVPQTCNLLCQQRLMQIGLGLRPMGGGWSRWCGFLYDMPQVRGNCGTCNICVLPKTAAV